MSTPAATTDELIAAEAMADACEPVAVTDPVIIVAISQVYNP